ncbi:MAG: type I restriction endonuclease subunit R [Aestuariivita sp.]|nr:type I restriction endonuclease subunit R [Aestuariivita sp.]
MNEPMTARKNTVEQDIEDALISKLQGLNYVYRADIRDRATLEGNFRQKFEELNRVRLTDTEFKRLLGQIVQADVFATAQALRQRETFMRDDDTPLHYTLVNTKDWCKNTFEVIHQLKINTDYSHHRYDVIILMNGIPLVQIELKALGINPKKAMEQIVQYKTDPGNGYTRTLLCFIQFFVVSNRTETWYFANNNLKHFEFGAEEPFLPVYQFADQANTKITHLDTFAEHVFSKCTLARMISRYMVLVATERKLLMMRPYQIYAVQAITACIDQKRGNGYVWHTTGSGKTLTSFKAATLLKANEAIHKCLFVVDRKDLDRQTRDEFNRFQENCVEENIDTATLVRRLLSKDYADKVIVTTIQKLGRALDGRNPYTQQLTPLRDARMVFIFDECHRSQFGERHEAITSFFPNAQFFGFTGTPIFDKNALMHQIEGQIKRPRTTKDIFEKELHAYTITDAIEDRTVLRFHVDYFNHSNGNDVDERKHKKAVVRQILEKHDTATHGRRFNALFATRSIKDAIAYYDLFKAHQKQRLATHPDFKPLNIATVFSPPPAAGDPIREQMQEDLPQEYEDNQHEPEVKTAALKTILADYNRQYQTHHDLSTFDNYQKDIQQRIKEHAFPNKDLPRKGAEKIDLTIVVDMLLTGFDARFLNTLYVDKTLTYHRLIQAFSRTNRTLNATKPYGNILDFRRQKDNVNKAIVLFSRGQTEEARRIWLVEDAATVMTEFRTCMNDLTAFMDSQGLEATPEQVLNLKGNDARIQFINRFKDIQRCKIKLDQYTDLTDAQCHEIEQMLGTDDLNAFRGVYLEVVRRLKEGDGTNRPNPDVEDKTEANTQNDDPNDPSGSETRGNERGIDDVDFELSLFSSVVIDYDYIMQLIARYTRSDSQQTDTLTRTELIGLIQSDAKFLDERDVITEYVHSLKKGEALDQEAVKEGYLHFKAHKEVEKITTIAQKNGLDADSLAVFVKTILQTRIFDGEQLTDLMAPLNLGWRARVDRERALMDDLLPILRKQAESREIAGLDAYERDGTNG